MVKTLLWRYVVLPSEKLIVFFHILKLEMSAAELLGDGMRGMFACLRRWCTEHKLSDDHGFKHFMEVGDHATLASSGLTDFQTLAVLLAAILHDVDDRKLKIPPLKNYAAEKFPWASFFLDISFVNSYVKDYVLDMIDLVSTSKNGDTPYDPEWMLIPRYADRITATGHVGTQRCAEVTKKIGNQRAAPDTVLVFDEKELEQVMKGRTLDDYIKSGGKSKSQIDHYYDKLLHLHVGIHIKNAYIEEQMKAGYGILKEHLFKLCKEEKEARAASAVK